MLSDQIHDNMADLLWLITFIGAVVALWKVVATWRESRYQRRAAEDANVRLLNSLNKELHPNCGSSLRDQVDDIRAQVAGVRELLAQMRTESQERDSRLEATHDGLHARIDGLFALQSGGSQDLGRRAAQHQRRREEQVSDER